MCARRVSSSKDTQDLKNIATDLCLRWCGPVYGPCSRNVAVQPKENKGSFTLTSVSGRAASLQLVTNPVLRLLLELTVRGQHQHYGDGGLLALQLAARLLKVGLDLGSSPGRRLEVVRAYHQVLDWCVFALGGTVLGTPDPDGANPPHAGSSLPIQLPLSWSHLPSILALVRSVIMPKRLTGLDAKEVEHVGALLVKAFLNGVDVRDGSLTPAIRIVPVVGLPPQESFTLEGVLMKTVLDPQASALLPLHGPVVALFDVPLEPLSPAQDHPQDSVKMDESHQWAFQVALEATGSEGWSVSATELQGLMELPGALVDLGVQVIGCQKGIHPALQQALLIRGIVPIPRLSLIHIGNVARTCGAIPISSKQPSPMWKRCLGRAGCVSEKVVQGQQYISIHGSEGILHTHHDTASPQTLVVGVMSESAGDELHSVLESGIKVLAGALKVPFVTAGGGCCEMLLAAGIRQQEQEKLRHGGAYRQQSVHQQAVERFAASLEAIAAELVPLGNKADVVEAWREGLIQAGRSYQEGAPGLRPVAAYVGWNHATQQIEPVASWQPGDPFVSGPEVLDLAAAKSGALAAAVEAACTIIRLDGMLLGTE